MAVKALGGALGFLTRIPVGRDRESWRAFQATPAAFPLAGYLVGVVIAAPLLLPVPPPVAGFVFVVGVYVVTGINHVDGVADVGDALVAHGGSKLEAMRDVDTGAGGVLAVAVVVLGLWTAGLVLAGLPFLAVVGLVVGGEVAAKLGMALAVCLGDASHEGMGSMFTESLEKRGFVPALVVALPVALLTLPSPASAACVVAALCVAVGSLLWAGSWLGGVNGDVLGMVNEAGRVAALHVGVSVWMLW